MLILSLYTNLFFFFPFSFLFDLVVTTYNSWFDSYLSSIQIVDNNQFHDILGNWPLVLNQFIIQISGSLFKSFNTIRIVVIM